MFNLQKDDTAKYAVSLVVAALESGAIKLQGPVSMSGAKAMAEDDALYLNTLLNALAANLSGVKNA
jgi:hypothetical protein